MIDPELESDSSRDDLVGRVVAGRYQLVRLLGLGGMGAVYEAVQLELARRVAVKVLLDGDERAVARARQEALLVAAIGHPNVVQVTDLVSDEDVPVAIVMELLEGESLAVLLSREGRLAPAHAAAIAIQMLAGLGAAHARGIVHRDVKPSNVQIVPSAGHAPDLVKLLDFGVAKSLEASHHRTTAGIALGTPAYMAPEQVLGHAVDARADLYAVGACLFQMVTGERVIGPAMGPAVAKAIAALDPAALAGRIEDRALAAVVATALARAPEDRWPSAEAMATALGQIASGLSRTAQILCDARSEPALPAVRAEEAPPPVSIGEIVADKYRVERILGEGGMGIVVLARHLDLDQPVALKFLLPRAASQPLLVERFVREARSAVRLKGPHVARTFDTGRLPSGCPYIVMEYLEGRDVEAELRARGQPLGVEEAASLILQASEALAEAHAFGIVHRDLKPANLFLARGHDGRPVLKILDFGISKAGPRETPVGTAEDTLTKTEMVFGSPSYMSPEQVQSTKDVDPRSDLWALGVILYELLTLRLPFEAPTAMATVLKARSAPPVSPRVHRPDLPEAVERIILTCLAKDRDDRFADVTRLAAALAPFAGARDRGRVERIADVGRQGSEGALARSLASEREIGAWNRTPLTLETGRRATVARAAILGGGAALAAIAGAALVLPGWSRAPAGVRATATTSITADDRPPAVPPAAAAAAQGAPSAEGLAAASPPPSTPATSSATPAGSTSSRPSPSEASMTSVAPPPPIPRTRPHRPAAAPGPNLAPPPPAASAAPPAASAAPPAKADAGPHFWTVRE